MSKSSSPRGRATMKDVATLAGVGVKTVSRVINDEPNVTPATAQRVWDAVRELDYQLDLQARSLRRSDGHTRTLGLLVGSVDNQFAGVIHRTVEDAAAERGVAVFAASMDDDAHRESQAVRGFLQRRVDGLILTTAVRKPAYLGQIRDRGVPVVYVDREPDVPDLDTVSSTNRAGAAAGTAHLIAGGHRRIALLGDRLELATAHQRRAGYLDALTASGLPVPEDLMVTELAEADDAAVALAALLASDDPPTAVFSAQNLITIGALHALRSAGLSRTVALVGFDDVPLADLMDPGVTVVAQDPQMIGMIAAERIFARLEGDTSEPIRMRVPTVLIRRGTGEIPPPG